MREADRLLPQTCLDLRIWKDGTRPIQNKVLKLHKNIAVAEEKKHLTNTRSTTHGHIHTRGIPRLAQGLNHSYEVKKLLFIKACRHFANCMQVFFFRVHITINHQTHFIS
jgi:hypothetical protein